MKPQTKDDRHFTAEQIEPYLGSYRDNFILGSNDIRAGNDDAVTMTALDCSKKGNLNASGSLSVGNATLIDRHNRKFCCHRSTLIPESLND